MPIGRQPRGARGTVDRPYSALRLRLVLAVFGAIVCAVGAVLTWRTGATGFSIFFAILAVIAVIDMIVIVIRLSRR